MKLVFFVKYLEQLQFDPCRELIFQLGQVFGRITLNLKLVFFVKYLEQLQFDPCRELIFQLGQVELVEQMHLNYSNEQKVVRLIPVLVTL